MNAEKNDCTYFPFSSYSTKSLPASVARVWRYRNLFITITITITSDRKNSQLVSSGTKMTDLRILDAAAACN